ncbi:hypothetical protein V5O48_002281 [Marasmius crinis-equi]|uniref:DUF6699 domain-containing protein n=1 Tax=Marasmius crinis-equi TaxID=585013 RepID=A0ABR3FW03_9AGAR
MNRLFRSSTISDRKDYFPKTPKIISVALPNSPTGSSFPATQSFMMPRNITPAVHSRSATPVTSSGRRHTIPDDSHYRHGRSRTNSTSSHGTSEKPLKGILKNSTSGTRPPDSSRTTPVSASTRSSGRQSIAVPLESQPPRDRAMSTSGTFSLAMKPLKGILKKTTAKPTGQADPPPHSSHSIARSSSMSGRKVTNYSMSDTEGYTRHATRGSSKSSKLHDYHHKDVDSKPPSKYDSKDTAYHAHDEKITTRKGWGEKNSLSGRDASLIASGTETPDLKKMKRGSYSGMPFHSSHITTEPLKSPVISLHWVLIRQDSPKKRPRDCTRLARIFDMAYQPDPHPYDPTGSYKAGALMYDTWARSYSEDPADFRVAASSHCTVREMRLVMSANSEWRTTVRAREGSTQGIRPIDIFRAIFDMLQAPLTRRELELIGMNAEGLRSCERFRDERIRTSPVLPEVAFSKGCLRVDVLGNRRYFNGLTQSGAEWIVENCHPKEAA